MNYLLLNVIIKKVLCARFFEMFEVAGESIVLLSDHVKPVEADVNLKCSTSRNRARPKYLDDCATMKLIRWGI